MERRHFVQTVGTVTVLGLAGCSSGDENPEVDGEDASQEEEGNVDTDETEQTEDDEPEQPEEQAPTLEEFEYPAGATQAGIDTEQLYGTHESTLTDAGSLTFVREREESHGGSQFSIAETNRFDSNNISQEIVDDGNSESVWAPATEDVAYVRMDSGFEEGYRIDNRPPRTNEATGLNGFRRILLETEWSEAQTVIELEDDDGFAVTYEATGHSDRIGFGGEIESFEATIAVTESAYISELDYELTENQGGQTFERDVTSGVSAVGETTVEEPDWAATAREQGAQFSIAMTDDQTAYELELINGDEISTDARISLRDSQGRGAEQLQQPLEVGDRLYVGLSENNALLTDAEQVPDGARSLNGFNRLAIRSEFTLLEYEHQVR